MRKYMSVMGLILLSTSSFANEHQLMNKKQCTEMKEGIRYFLGVADYLFKEVKKLEKEKDLFDVVMAANWFISSS